MMMSVEQRPELEFACETEVLGENLLCAILCTTNPTIPNSDRRCGKPVANRLSYGMAFGITT
jgi:hypothetical protein